LRALRVVFDVRLAGAAAGRKGKKRDGMAFSLTKQKQSELDQDIRLYECIAAARANFYDQIVERSNPEAKADPRELRGDTVYQIAEFFYFLHIFGIRTPQKLRALAEIHTDKISKLMKNPEEQKKLGVYAQRLGDALFDSEEKLERLIIHSADGLIRLSQSDLSRLLVEYMSPETCRQAVKVLGEAGYLRLTKSPFGAILVSSSGDLEEIFAEHVRNLRLMIQGQ